MGSNIQVIRLREKGILRKNGLETIGFMFKLEIDISVHHTYAQINPFIPFSSIWIFETDSFEIKIFSIIFDCVVFTPPILSLNPTIFDVHKSFFNSVQKSEMWNGMRTPYKACTSQSQGKMPRRTKNALWLTHTH